MCYHVCIMMHVKDPYLSVVRVGHCFSLAGFCLSLYDLHALNRDDNMIQTNSNKTTYQQAQSLFHKWNNPSTLVYKGKYTGRVGQVQGM